MKPIPAFLLASVCLSFGGIAEAACPTSYNLTFPPGFTCFAIHLNVAGGNTMDRLFPSAPDFATVYVWRCGNGWDVDYFDSFSGGWQANLTLPPGSAAFFFNPSAALTLMPFGN